MCAGSANRAGCPGLILGVNFRNCWILHVKFIFNFIQQLSDFIPLLSAVATSSVKQEAANELTTAISAPDPTQMYGTVSRALVADGRLKCEPAPVADGRLKCETAPNDWFLATKCKHCSTKVALLSNELQTRRYRVHIENDGRNSCSQHYRPS